MTDKKTIKIIVDKKLLFTFAEVFDDRYEKPVDKAGIIR